MIFARCQSLRHDLAVLDYLSDFICCLLYGCNQIFVCQDGSSYIWNDHRG